MPLLKQAAAAVVHHELARRRILPGKDEGKAVTGRGQPCRKAKLPAKYRPENRTH
jgi:hypothetical protein